MLVNSADSHVLEPLDLWETRLPTHLRDRSIHTKVEEEWEHIFVDHVQVRHARVDFREAQRPPGANDPHARLLDLDDEGIWSELIFPSLGLWLYLIVDAELARESARVYNDWLISEFCAVSPRFVPIALVPVVSIDDAVAEVERVAKLGYQGVNIPATPPSPYNSEEYDRLWAAVQDAGMNLCFHVGTGSDPIVARGLGGAVLNYTETFFPPQRAVAQLVASGVLDRHMSLQVVVIEGGASWLPGLMERMDEGYRQHQRFVRPKLTGLPSEIVTRQIHATFQHDRALLETLHITGVESVMWGSDYPHLEGTWPNSQAALDEIFAGVDDNVRTAVAGGTMAKLFTLAQPS